MSDYDLSRMKVLVVDDHPPMRKIIVEILRELGVIDFVEVDDGRAALSALADFKPDIIFTDNIMKPMGGLELTRTIRAGQEGIDPTTPIIMVSAYTEKERIFEARDGGITEFLAKPVSTKSILARLRVVFEKPRPFVRSKRFFGPDRRRRGEGPEGVERRGHHPEHPSQDGWERRF